jgi:hypothetical protein
VTNIKIFMKPGNKNKSGEKRPEIKMKNPPQGEMNGYHHSGLHAGHDQGSTLGSRGDHFKERTGSKTTDYGSRTSKK